MIKTTRLSLIRAVGGAKRWSPMQGKVASSSRQATSLDRYTIVHGVSSARRSVTAEFDVGPGIDLRHNGETASPRSSQKAVGGDGISKYCYSETEMNMTRRRIAKEVFRNDTKKGASDPPLERMTEHGKQYMFDEGRSQFRERFIRTFPGLDALAEAVACLYGCDNSVIRSPTSSTSSAVADGKKEGNEKGGGGLTDREHWYRKLGLGVDHESLRETSERVVAQLAAAEAAQRSLSGQPSSSGLSDDVDDESTSLSAIESELAELGGVSGLSESELELLGAVEASTATSDWDSINMDDSSSSSISSSSSSSSVAATQSAEASSTVGEASEEPGVTVVESQYAAIYDAFQRYNSGQPLANLIPTDLTHIHEAQELSTRVRWRQLLELLVKEEFHLVSRPNHNNNNDTDGDSSSGKSDMTVMGEMDGILRTKKLFDATAMKATAVAPHLVERATSSTMENMRRDVSAHDRLSE